jgi:CDP-diacylglycerol--serine O-phosphatidyltransferase
MNIFSKVKIADLFTLANGLLGFIAITYIVDHNYLAASLLILVAMVMDGLDGYIARLTGSERALGRILDSISDSISFCVAPALLIYGIFYDKEENFLLSVNNLLTLAASALLAIFGIARLVRYSGKDFSAPTFKGLPTPACALATILLCYLFAGEKASFFYIANQPHVVLLFCLAMAFVMISDIPYPKVRGWIRGMTLAGIILTAIPAILGLIFPGLYMIIIRAFAGLAFVLIMGYVVGGPLIAWWSAREVPSHG